MKVLHINTSVNGGAFNGAYRLHKALLNSGIESKMLVRDLTNSKDLKEVFQYNHEENTANIFNRALARFGVTQTSMQKKWKLMQGLTGQFEVISFPFSEYDITKSELYKQADIINLHWMGGYLDYKSFFKKNTKPVVFTLRDSYPFLGIFHLQKDFARNGQEWQRLDLKMRKVKTRALSRTKQPVAVVGISNWIKNQSLNYEILANYPHVCIHNCIDSKLFNSIEINKAKSLLNIDPSRVVFSFVADSVNRINKGYNELIDAINDINNPNIELLSIGNRIEKSCNIHIRHRHLGNLDSNQLQIVYSASDAFIFPTKEESLGNVMLEAMSCGTPVIGTPVGGLLDVIKPDFNGILSKDVSSKGLKFAIEEFIQKKDQFNRDQIRQYIIENFSEEKIAQQYIDIYKKTLDIEKTT